MIWFVIFRFTMIYMSLQKLVREWKLMFFIIMCKGMNNPINETNFHDSDETVTSNTKSSKGLVLTFQC
jgi:hypothetical protein